MQSTVRSVAQTSGRCIRVGILGCGVDGRSVAEYLQKQTEVCTIVIFDDSLKREDDVPSTCERGFDLESIDLLFRSPGFPLTHPFIIEAKEKRIPITSSTIEVLRSFSGVTVGITGSNGKTTCTALVENFLKAEYGLDHVERGGNDGVPRLDLIDDASSPADCVMLSGAMRSEATNGADEARSAGACAALGRSTHHDTFLVLELSSFQLIDCPISPNVAVVLNLSPNHLDWHKDMKEYAEAKRQIVAHQGGAGGSPAQQSDIAILNQNDPIVKTFAEGIQSEVHWFADDVPLAQVRCISHPDTIRAAVTAARALSVSEENILKILREFKGVPHRLEFVRELNGVKFYNDSSCTTPESAIVACKAFPKGSLTLLMGGRDKGMDFSKLYEVIKERDVAVIPYGEMAPIFVQALDRKSHIPHLTSQDFKATIELARSSGRPNIVLSPACASFDMFKNAKERGNIFLQLVQQL
jgi:UDP-N-acetylmuramoylalanine--D-glutamate ligase